MRTNKRYVIYGLIAMGALAAWNFRPTQLATDGSKSASSPAQGASQSAVEPGQTFSAAAAPTPSQESAANTAPPANVHPAYAKYRELKKKTLMTAAEREQFEQALGDPALIASAEATLINDSVEQEARMKAVEYFSQAIRVRDANVRAAVAQAVTKILKLERIKEGMPRELQRSLIGDMAELYRILLVYQPEKAKALLEEAKGTHNYRIFQFAEAVQKEME